MPPSELAALARLGSLREKLRRVVTDLSGFSPSDECILPVSCLRVSEAEVREIADWLTLLGFEPSARRLVRHWDNFLKRGTDILWAAVADDATPLGEDQVLVFCGIAVEFGRFVEELEQLVSESQPPQDVETEPKRRRRRRKTDAAPRPLTAKQAEVVHIVGECKGNLAEAAERLGVDRATVRQHYQAAMKKIGKQAVKHATKSLPTDRRGQDNLSPDDDRRRG